MCITFFNKKNFEFLQRIEDLAGIRMEWVPVPSEKETSLAKNKDILNKLNDVNMDIIDNFDAIADELIK